MVAGGVIPGAGVAGIRIDAVLFTPRFNGRPLASVNSTPIAPIDSIAVPVPLSTITPGIKSILMLGSIGVIVTRAVPINAEPPTFTKLPAGKSTRATEPGTRKILAFAALKLSVTPTECITIRFAKKLLSPADAAARMVLAYPLLVMRNTAGVSTDKSKLKLPSAAVVSTILVPSTAIVAAPTGTPNSSTTVPVATTYSGATELAAVELGATELGPAELDAAEVDTATLDTEELGAIELAASELEEIRLGTEELEISGNETSTLDAAELETPELELVELENSALEDDAGATELNGTSTSESLPGLEIALDTVLESADEIVTRALLRADEDPEEDLLEPPPQAVNPTTNRHNTHCV